MSDTLQTVTVSETGEGLFTQRITAGAHLLSADEPAALGGNDSAPAPYELLMAALGACTSMTLRMYARQKNWPLEKTSVTLTHRKEVQTDGIKKDIFTRTIHLTGDLDETQRARLLEIAGKCPVHRTLEGSSLIQSELSSD